MESYKTDGSPQQITLQVQAGIVGIATTRVDLKIENKYTKLFDSESGFGGNILPSTVEKNAKLKDTILRIRTVINLSNLTPEQLEKAIETLFIIYSLSGGPEGEKQYEALKNDALKIDEENVIVTKKIMFV